VYQLNLIPVDTNLNFMRWRWAALCAALVVILGSLALIGVRGFNYALDFTGGTVVEVTMAQPLPVDDVRDRLEKANFASPQVQSMGGGASVLVRLQPETSHAILDGSHNTQIAEGIRVALSEGDAHATIASADFVGPVVGATLARDALNACIFVLIGFLIYVSVRFEWKFAVAATISTLTTVLIVAAYFSATWTEFDLTSLAGLLAAMAFAINDTIVVFDRVRENFRTTRHDPVEVVNRSINQTLGRTLITSVVYLLSCLALYLYAGGSLEGLAMGNMISAVVAGLSTTFLACPLLTMGVLTVRRQDLATKTSAAADLNKRP
jgi:preprotein translocase subunit SecF